MYNQSLIWFAGLTDIQQVNLINIYYPSDTLEYLTVGKIHYMWSGELLNH